MEQKNRKKKQRPVLWILPVLFLLSIGLGFWQRDNIAAFLAGWNSGSAEIEQRFEDNRQMVRDAVEDLPVRDLTEEEREMLRSGELAGAQMEALLVDTEEQDPYRKALSELIARIYVLRETYIIQLDGMEAQAKEEYGRFSEKEKSKSRLTKWAAEYVSAATKMENECDDEMDIIIDDMTQLIKENNGDLSLLDKVIDGYANEKSLKKSMYTAKLRERGLL